MFLGGLEIDQGIKWVNMSNVRKDVSEGMMMISVCIVLVYILKAHSIDLCVSFVGFEHVIFSVIIHRNGFFKLLVKFLQITCYIVRKGSKLFKKNT